jgi:CubicO group peptidase (beta-lactamase class C family)
MNYLRLSVIIILLILLSFNPSPLADDRISSSKELIKDYTKSGHLNGVILVAEKGKLLFAQSSGLANIAWNIPNNIETKYRIYSMTKQFTALLIMQFVESGKLDLEKPITTYLPYYRKDVGDRVTVHQLLTHTHGIEEGYERLPSFLMFDPTRQLIEKYFSNQFEFEPGEKFRYSGLLGYHILGAIIEVISDKPYRQVLHEKILDPLGMKNTHYLDYQTIIEKRASDYFRTRDGFVYRIQAYPVHADGATSIVSTVEDLLVWDQALYSNELLSSEYMNLIFSSHIKVDENRAYGYGWYISDIDLGVEKKRIFYHTGGGTGLILRSVSDQRTIISLNNLISNELYNISLEILDLLDK